jgi:hypothetical protein
VASSGVKTRYHVSFFVISKGELCLIPVVPGVFHSNNRFHAGIDVFRGKSADSDEVVPYFILFKFQLFFIGERLKLAAAALAVEGAGGLNTKRRRHKYLLQLCIGIVFLRFHDLHLYRVADNRIFDKQNKTVGFSYSFAFDPGVRYLHCENVILFYFHRALLHPCHSDVGFK